jgi:hypothetical protein
MGVIGKILGAGAVARDVGEAVGNVAEVLVGNRAAREAMAGQLATAAVEQFGAEFAGGAGRFDGFVDGLNRLPRPLLALSTIGLFGYAMAEPAGFGTRMQSLALVPEPLWWLLGAIVSFYFGARELHHQRQRPRLPLPTMLAPSVVPAGAAALAAPALSATVDPDHNAAVEEWRRLRGQVRGSATGGSSAPSARASGPGCG